VPMAKTAHANARAVSGVNGVGAELDMTVLQ
jgi:hypothetical protein